MNIIYFSLASPPFSPCLSWGQDDRGDSSWNSSSSFQTLWKCTAEGKHQERLSLLALHLQNKKQTHRGKEKKNKMSGCCFILIPLLFINVCKDPYFLTPQIKPSLKQQTEHITSDVFTTWQNVLSTSIQFIFLKIQCSLCLLEFL